MTNYKRGDVVLVLFPNSDLQTFKKRPALIVQADNLETDLPQRFFSLTNYVQASNIKIVRLVKKFAETFLFVRLAKTFWITILSQFSF